MSTAFCLFETIIGTAGLAWNPRGICGIQLPEPEAARVRARLRRRFPAAPESEPPASIQHAITLMSALLNGELVELSSVELDLDSVPAFDRQVYKAARNIQPGETATYGDLARRLGDVHLAREVGQALARNPFPIVVPCHRVIASNGRLGGFSAVGGIATKQRLLAIEQANGSWQLPLIR